MVSKAWLIVRLVLACLGAFAGLTAAPTFAHLQAYETCGLAVLSGFFAVLLVAVLSKKVHDLRRQHRYMRLRVATNSSEPLAVGPPHRLGFSPCVTTFLFVLGILGNLLGLAAMVGYGVWAGIHHEKLNAQSHWLGIVWGWMTWKWSFGLLWETRPKREPYQEAY
ncbi:hypothetical protein QOT17_002440 [Balamuthia mandrillaris]